MPSPRLRDATIGYSGQTLICGFEDSDGVLSNITQMNLNNIQNVSVNGARGTFTLTFSGQTTEAIPVGSFPADVQEALEDLSNIGTGNVSVTGFGIYRVEFIGSLAASVQSTITIDTTSVLPDFASTPSTAASNTQPAVIICNLDAGLVTSGPIAVYSGGFGSTLQAIPRVGTKYLPSSVSYTFTGLAVGNYLIQTDWEANYYGPADLPFRFYDGNTFRSLVHLNTCNPPPSPTTINSGRSNGLANDGNFLFGDICTIYVASGTLTVIVLDEFSHDNGSLGSDLGSVDAVRILPHVSTGDASSITVSASSTVVFPGGSPTIKINGGSPITLLSPIWALVEQNLPYLLFLLPSPVINSDVVTLTMDAGAVITVAGAVPAITNGAVLNHVGQSLLPAVATGTKSLRVGYNIEAPNYYQVAATYADLMKISSDWIGLDASGLDAHGYPSSSSSGTYCFLNFPPNNTVDSRCYRNAPTGLYTVVYSGTGTATLLNLTNALITERQDLAVNPSNHINRVRVFDVQLLDSSAEYSPSVELYITGVITNAAVYLPGINTDGSQKFHPEFLRMLRGSAALRSMDAFNTNNSSVVDYADFADSSHRSYSDTTERNRVSTISKIEPWDDPGGGAFHNFFLPVYLKMKVTTTADHGLKSGQIVYFSNNGGINVNITGGSVSSTDVTGHVSVVIYDSSIMSTREFAIGVYIGGTPVMTGTYTGGGQTLVVIGSGMPPIDMVDLCNQVGSDFWCNIPHAATNDCVDALATMIAGGLNSGLKAYVEYTNEHWNYSSAFGQSRYCEGMGNVSGLTATEYYTRRANEIHNRFHTIFAAAGRGNDHVRLFGAQALNPSVATNIITYAYAHSYPIDALHIAPYISVGPANQPGMAGLYTSLNIEQLMDVSEAGVKYYDFGDMVRNHYTELTKVDGSGHPMFPNAKVVAYEGGPAFGSLATADGYPIADLVRATYSQAWHNHPRLRGVILTVLKQLQDAGMPLFVDFNISFIYANEGGTNVSCYGAYIGWDQQPGTGDGSDGQFDNRTSLHDSSRVVSVIGGAFNWWNSITTHPKWKNTTVVSHSRGYRGKRIK